MKVAFGCAQYLSLADKCPVSSVGGVTFDVEVIACKPALLSASPAEVHGPADPAEILFC